MKYSALYVIPATTEIREAETRALWWQEESPFMVPSDSVFFGDRPYHLLNHSTFTNVFRRRLAPANIERSTPFLTVHSFRHTYNNVERRAVGLYDSWLDAAHTMLGYDEDGCEVCGAFLSWSGLASDTTFKTVLQAMINAIPRVRHEARTLDALRLKLFENLTPSTQQGELFEQEEGEVKEADEDCNIEDTLRDILRLEINI